MKRWIAMSLCVLLCIAIGCTMIGRGGEEAESGYKVYFREADLSNTLSGEALRPELVYLEEGANVQTQMEQLLECLLQGPQDETLSAIVPAGTTLLSVKQRGVLATVDLSGQYSALSGIALTLADYAITQTLTQLPGVMLVKITVRGRELPYRTGRTLSQRDILFPTKEDIVSSVAAKLYFLNTEGEFTPVTETLSLYEGDTQVGAVVRAVEKGPESKELLPVIPQGFRVRSVWLTDDICYVNFSSAQIETLNDPGAVELIRQALEHSLCSLETVEEVCFLVDGIAA